ncbi:Saf-pilin pilus formation protein SafA [Salmonella enterica]|nr:Saf-pilin pilus formation protein SafA [Salmonella enterica]
MRNVKNLIIASALSIMDASCYAGSLVSNTSTSVSADVNFSNPGQLPEVVGNDSDVWTVIGKSGNTIKVTFGGVGCGNKGSLVDGASHKWWVYNMADKVAVKLSGSQTVKADTYPVTLHIAEYQA